MIPIRRILLRTVSSILGEISYLSQTDLKVGMNCPGAYFSSTKMARKTLWCALLPGKSSLANSSRSRNLDILLQLNSIFVPGTPLHLVTLQWGIALTFKSFAVIQFIYQKNDSQVVLEHYLEQMQIWILQLTITRTLLYFAICTIQIRCFLSTRENIIVNLDWWVPIQEMTKKKLWEMGKSVEWKMLEPPRDLWTDRRRGLV